jgi:hypothetical protein
MGIPEGVGCFAASVLSAVLACPASAQSYKHAHRWQLDQDLFGPHNEDRDYTQGLALDLFAQRDDPGAYPNRWWVIQPIHEALDALAPSLSLDPGDARPRLITSMGIGSIAFTPNDLGKQTPVLDDRPYANLFYYTERRIEETPQGSLGTELRVGILGTNAAEFVQTKIHQANRAVFNNDRPKEPAGWGNQISDGGALTALYRVSSDRLLDEGENHDLALTSDVNLGYQVNAALGLTWRLGRLRNGTHTTPFDPISRANFVPALTAGDRYVFCAAKVRGVVFDALLQGHFGHNAHVIKSKDVTKLVLHAAIGFSTTFGKSRQLTYTINARTHEFDVEGRTHWWAGASYSTRY